MRKKVKRGPGRPPKNSKSTPKKVIVDQMNEPRPLPMGRLEFEEWSNRIISGAIIPGEVWANKFEADSTNEEKHKAFINSQKHALSQMIMHLGPTESHKPDAYFIHSLRKAACNQVAHNIGTELLAEAKARKLTEAE
jgi:hypothetical protein